MLGGVDMNNIRFAVANNACLYYVFVGACPTLVGGLGPTSSFLRMKIYGIADFIHINSYAIILTTKEKPFVHILYSTKSLSSWSPCYEHLPRSD